jgi:hypothetical protein
MADSYVARVKGTYGTLPRGYPWVFIVWYAITGTLFATVEVHSWYGIAGGVLIFAGGLCTVALVRNAKTPSFSAHPGGIRLGDQRHRIQIPWQEIQEIRVSPAADGALAEVVLMPSTPLTRRRLPPAAEVLLSVVPGSQLFLRPPLLDPVTDPAGYRAPLWRTTPDEVAKGLRALAPDSVAIVTAMSS